MRLETVVAELKGDQPRRPTEDRVRAAPVARWHNYRSFKRRRILDALQLPRLNQRDVSWNHEGEVHPARLADVSGHRDRIGFAGVHRIRDHLESKFRRE